MGILETLNRAQELFKNMMKEANHADSPWSAETIGLMNLVPGEINKQISDLPFNDLSPAEVERLSMLIEECAEVQHIATKILRHGYNSYHPADEDQTTNRELLHRELVDLRAIQNVMNDCQDIEEVHGLGSEVRSTRLGKFRYTHHQDEKVFVK